MNKQISLSTQLLNSLDFTAEKKGYDNENKSASSQLLELRKRNKPKFSEDYISFENRKSVKMKPLLAQISSSEVEHPTTWKSAKKSKSDVKKSAPISKSKRLRIAKGEDYNNKLSVKVKKKTSKFQRKNNLKK
jgi:hypothetical protein